MPFAQVVVGPPGAGKTTYCDAMQQLLGAMGRPCTVVNLDPAQTAAPYKCDIDVCDLVALEDVMEELNLGPNGGMIYCMDFLLKNLPWLKERFHEQKHEYMLVDFPGQVELYTHDGSTKRILRAIESWGVRMVAVHLVDAHHCSDAAKFISVSMLSLAATINLELPHVNVLTKVDLLRQYGQLAFQLESYTDMDGLDMLLEHLEQDEFSSRHRKLNEAIVGLLEDYNMVSFSVMSILDSESTQAVLRIVDKAVGYVHRPTEPQENAIAQSTVSDTKHDSNADDSTVAAAPYLDPSAAMPTPSPAPAHSTGRTSNRKLQRATLTDVQVDYEYGYGLD